MNGPTGSPVFQIHPSLRCNLSCLHCYSSSSPWATTELDPGVVCDAIADAAAIGYRVVSVSGGEPFLYRGLAEVLAFAKGLGLRTTVTTNGMFLEPRRLDPLASLVDVLAISLDGDAIRHDAMRGRAGAYERTMRGIEAVRRRGFSFGFIHTLSPQSWDHIESIVEFAVGVGAKLVQVHPLELAGRAGAKLRADACDDVTLVRAYIVSVLLAVRYADRIAIQYDVLDTGRLAESPELVYAGPRAGGSGLAAEDLSILVLEADGTVVPMTFGFGREYRVGDVTRERLSDAWPRFFRDGYPRFRDLCRRVHAAITVPDAPRFVNWFEILHDASRAPTHGVPTASA